MAVVKRETLESFASYNKALTDSVESGGVFLGQTSFSL